MKALNIPGGNMLRELPPTTSAGTVFMTVMRLPLPPPVRIPAAVVAAAATWAVLTHMRRKP